MAMAWLYLVISSIMLINISKVYGDIFVNFTILESAVAKGAVCLDGSPPVYSYVEGKGNGSNSWMIFMEGGGWCITRYECLRRSNSYLGSGNLSVQNGYSFSGILDSDCLFNPDFCNWHKVYVHYCDGSVFMSDIEQPVPVHGVNVTFRGARIYKAMMEEFLKKGMGKAENAILTGASAGGLSTIFHCDKFRALFPNTSRVKCISDSGFFIHGKGPFANYFEREFSHVVAVHELSNLFPTSCTSQRAPNLCFFPQYLVGDISTPLFIIESAFDRFQVEYILMRAYGGDAEWRDCRHSLALCNSTQLGILKDFGMSFVETLQKLDYSSSRGMFVHSCYQHTHIWKNQWWACSSVAGIELLANKTIKQAVGDWYFDRSTFHEIETQNVLPRNCSSPFDDRLERKCVAALSPSGSRALVSNLYAIFICMIFWLFLYLN